VINSDKHSSFQHCSINYKYKMFLVQAPWQLLDSDLWISLHSQCSPLVSQNIRLGCKLPAVTNTQAFNTVVLITTVKSFLVQAPGHLLDSFFVIYKSPYILSVAPSLTRKILV
jgi:hypothetical protein